MKEKGKSKQHKNVGVEFYICFIMLFFKILIMTIFSLDKFYTAHDFFFFFFCLFAISWADPAAYGGSQARGLIKAAATGLGQSHSNEGSEPCLRPTPQLTATLDP